MNEIPTDVCKSRATSTSPTSPSPDQALLTGDRDDASTAQPGKLFSGDRGLPRSYSIQASQLWPFTTQDDSSALVHRCMTSCPDFSRSSKQPGVNGHIAASFTHYRQAKLMGRQRRFHPGWGAGITIIADAFLDLSPPRLRVFASASLFASAADGHGSLQGVPAIPRLQSL